MVISVTFDGVFGAETLGGGSRVPERSARLRVDGICGPETWGALIESSYGLGDRLLYSRAPMLRGDDVIDLQGRLNALGFDAGREDGILGPETETALRQFQREYGLEPDGVCGPATVTALVRVGSLAGGSVASVRERDTLRGQTRRLRDRRLFLVVDPGLAALGAGVARRLRGRGCDRRFPTPRATSTTCSRRRPTRSAPTCASPSAPGPSPAPAARTLRTRRSDPRRACASPPASPRSLRAVLPARR